MNEAIIKIDFVNQPDKNPDFGSVKAERLDQAQFEKYWDVPASMLSLFEKGGTYTVGFTTRRGTKRLFYNIKELRNSAAPAAPAAPAHPAIGHNSAPNGSSADKDKKISALALYNHSFPRYAALIEKEINHAVMGDFLFECQLAVDWAEMRYKKFWKQKNAAKRAPVPQPEFVDDADMF